MIPFSILSGQIRFPATIPYLNPLEIRILDLAPDYFTLRLPICYEVWIQKMESITLHFYLWEKQQYEALPLSLEKGTPDFFIEVVEKDRYWILCRISVKKSEFISLSQKLSQEYLAYMNGKLTLEDASLSASLSDYPEDQDFIFPENEKEAYGRWMEEVKRDRKDELSIIPKLSILLDQPDKVRKYLTLTKKEFLSAYWHGHELFWHPLARQEINGLHIGNPFCPHLLPELYEWKAVIEKAKEESLHLTMVLPPISQSFYDKMLEYMLSLHELCEKEHFVLDVECNDLGMMRATRDMAYCRTSHGILLHKHKKDSRFVYLRSLDKRAQSDACSSESHGSHHNHNPDYSDHAIYLPYYQTNTGTFCTLYATAVKGDRGQQIRIKDKGECQQICLQQVLLYPSHLPMVGKQNSLLGMNLDTLKNTEAFLQKTLKENVKEWVVINL